MKVIIKIDEYLQERNSVIFKTCRLNSHKSIDEFERIIKVTKNSSEKTILVAIYNNQNQRRYIGIKLD